MKTKILTLVLLFLLLPKPISSFEGSKPEEKVDPLSKPTIRKSKLVDYLEEAKIEFNPQDLTDYENATEIPLLIEYERPVYSGIMKIPEVITDYTGIRIVPTEKTVVNDIKSAVSSVGGKFKTQYTTVPYISIDPPLIRLKDFVSKLPKEVKKIYVDSKIRIMLNESVPIVKDLNKEPEIRANYGVLDGSGMKIAIIDTGIDKTHPDLDDLDDDPTTNDPKVIAEKCFCTGCCPNGQSIDDNAKDGNGHGTHVASIAAGTGQASNYKFVGVAPKSKLLAVKVLDDQGDGLSSDIISGIEWAVANGADIISISLGCGPNCRNKPLEDAVKQAISQGVVVVVAAGNSGPNYETIYTPGVVREAITVGATEKNDFVATFSSRGPTDEFLVKPDVVAPGVRICAARVINSTIDKEIQNRGRQSEFYICDNEYYYALSGTSMATPHVAGAVALIKQAHPDWTPEEIKYALRNTAIDSAFENMLTRGYGRIDVFNSILLENPPIVCWLNTSGKLEGKIDIIGNIRDTNFKNYSLFYDDFYEPQEWVKITESTIFPQDILYRSWDTDQLSDGEYLLKLVVSEINGRNSEDASVIQLDRIVYHEGWPKFFDNVVGFPTIGDLDNDEKFEVIIPREVYIYIFYHNGTNFPGWPVSEYLTNKYFYSYYSGVAVGDIDGDNYKEIIALGSNNSETETIVFAYRYNGSLLDGFPLKLNESLKGYRRYYPILTDLDDDKKLEIIIGLTNGIYALNENGSNVNGWPWTNDKGCYYIGAGDVDADTKVELVTICGNKIYVLDYKGRIVEGWPQITEKNLSIPVLGDLDNDRKLEIIVGEAFGEGDKTYAWYYNGTMINGWPTSMGECKYRSPPVVADINDDKMLEVIVSSDLLYVWHLNGTLVSGFPASPRGSYSIGWGTMSSPVVGDIDSDGRVEIIVNGNDDFIHIWHHKGSLMNNWPKKIGGPGNFALGDIDKNGYIELLFSGWACLRSFYCEGIAAIWDLNGSYDEYKIEWPTFQHNEKRTGLYTKSSQATLNCKTKDFTNCLTNSTCQCFVSNCNSGWIRTRLLDNSEITKYFEKKYFSINSGSKSGTSTGYISCNDDKKEYPIFIRIVG